MEELDPNSSQNNSPIPDRSDNVRPSSEPALATLWGWLIEISETVLPAIVIAVLINLFVAQATRVYGHSMEPTLHTNQRLVVEKVSYKLHLPHRGDVVVIHMPAHSRELLIKRVIALPGESIEVKEGGVYINGERLEEPYLSVETRGSYGPLTVPAEHVFVMGDNRGASNDSRSFGPVPIAQVIGRAWISYWPFEDLGLIE